MPHIQVLHHRATRPTTVVGLVHTLELVRTLALPRQAAGTRGPPHTPALVHTPARIHQVVGLVQAGIQGPVRIPRRRCRAMGTARSLVGMGV